MPVIDVGREIDPTGSTDTTASLIDFARSVPDCSTLRLAPGATYRLDGTWALDNRTCLTVDGNGAQVYTNVEGDSHRAHVAVSHAKGLTLRNLKIRGAGRNVGAHIDGGGGEREWQYGVSVLSSDDVTIDGCTITNVYGDFVYGGFRHDDPKRKTCRRLRILNNAMAYCGRQGIGLTAVDEVLIQANLIHEVAHATLDMEPGHRDEAVHNVQFLRNVCGRSLLGWLVAASTRPVTDVLAEANLVVGDSLRVMVVPTVNEQGLANRRQRFTIRDNRSDTPTLVGTNGLMTFVDTDGVTVTGNSQPIIPPAVGSKPTAVVLQGSTTNAVVRDNSFPGARAVNMPPYEVDPLSLGAVAYLDVNEADARSYGVKSGDPITRWPNLADGSKPFLQPLASKRPYYDPLGYNGFPGIVFPSGTSLRLLLDTPLTGPRTIMLVANSMGHVNYDLVACDGGTANEHVIGLQRWPDLQSGRWFSQSGDASTRILAIPRTSLRRMVLLEERGPTDRRNLAMGIGYYALGHPPYGDPPPLTGVTLGTDGAGRRPFFGAIAAYAAFPKILNDDELAALLGWASSIKQVK